MMSPARTWEGWTTLRARHLDTARVAANITSRTCRIIINPDDTIQGCFMEEDAFLNDTARAFGISRSEVEAAALDGRLEWQQDHWNQNEARLDGVVKELKVRRWMPGLESYESWKQWIMRLANMPYESPTERMSETKEEAFATL